MDRLVTFEHGKQVWRFAIEINLLETFRRGKEVSTKMCEWNEPISKFIN